MCIRDRFGELRELVGKEGEGLSISDRPEDGVEAGGHLEPLGSIYITYEPI